VTRDGTWDERAGAMQRTSAAMAVRALVTGIFSTRKIVALEPKIRAFSSWMIPA